MVPGANDAADQRRIMLHHHVETHGHDLIIDDGCDFLVRGSDIEGATARRPIGNEDWRRLFGEPISHLRCCNTRTVH
jgi:hypothetical protein